MNWLHTTYDLTLNGFIRQKRAERIAKEEAERTEKRVGDCYAVFQLFSAYELICLDNVLYIISFNFNVQFLD